ncbi:maleylpyruvate isomerase N-terminal domain-containing protein [Streptomyces sp. NPDC005181]|uniref:maleylpyruvate isomerase N-terminal domain-containing protein n=1 Tax=Streptomyces sp. NPDC005181 TaxID=3156869 RepID=UPI0033B85A6F
MGAIADTDTWLAGLHASSARLQRYVSRLSEQDLSQQSFADNWSIGQVLSHLGSAAEISTMLVERGIAGDATGPVRHELLPVWKRWNALSAPHQREAWQEAAARHLRLLDSLSAADRASVKVPYFAGLLSIPVYAGYRLSEQSVHAWDIEVALDPAAAIPAEEVGLLWERLDLVATRFRDHEALSRLSPGQLLVELTDQDRTLCLNLAAELHILPCEPADPTGSVSGPAEAVLRLIYCRNRPPQDSVVAGAATLEDVRSLFPGF